MKSRLLVILVNIFEKSVQVFYVTPLGLVLLRDGMNDNSTRGWVLIGTIARISVAFVGTTEWGSAACGITEPSSCIWCWSVKARWGFIFIAFVFVSKGTVTGL